MLLYEDKKFKIFSQTEELPDKTTLNISKNLTVSYLHRKTTQHATKFWCALLFMLSVISLSVNYTVHTLCISVSGDRSDINVTYKEMSLGKTITERPSEITKSVKNRYLPDRCILRYLNHFKYLHNPIQLYINKKLNLNCYYLLHQITIRSMYQTKLKNKTKLLWNYRIWKDGMNEHHSTIIGNHTRFAFKVG